MSRRQSFGLAAFAVLGAACNARPPWKPRVAPARQGAAPPAAPPVTPPEFAGLSDSVALRFYQRRGWRAGWTEDQAAALTDSLGDARRHGLDRAVFRPRNPPGAASMRQDIALTLTALRYAAALSSGYVHPAAIEKIFTLERNQADLAAGLERALSNGKLVDWLASLPPSDDEYKALSAAYMGSACQAPAGGDQRAPPQSAQPENAQPQSAAPQSAAPQSAAPQGATPQSATPESASPQTPPAAPAPEQTGPNQGAPKESLPEVGATPSESEPKRATVRPAERLRQLAANLERRRWLARTPPPTRIDVNTAGCFLSYLKPDTDPWAARVVLGKPGHETPSIQASFRRLVANPKWRVPMDIARREIFPKGGGYLRREHMRVVNGQVVQQSGPHNSLGLVKFDVEDPYAIYLHDTPAKSLFALPDRHKSHGCVRVQDAVGFARKLADERGKADAFDKALASGKTREVDIGQSIAVRLLYHTAYADEAGHVTVIADAYGWNDKLAAALGFPAAPPPAPGERADVDLGP